MKNINKKLIFLSVIVSLFVFANSVSAATYTDCRKRPGEGADQYYNYYPKYTCDYYYTSDDNYSNNVNQNYYSSQNSNYNNYSNNNNNNTNQPRPAQVISTANQTAKTTTVTVAKANTTTKNTTDTNYSDTYSNTTNDNQSVNRNNISALSMYGYNNFMPDTVFEWILAFFFILIIIVLARQFRKRDKHAH